MKNAHRYFSSVAIFMIIFTFCYAVSFANIGSDGFNADYYIQKGLDHAAKRNYIDAVDAFKKAILLDPNNAKGVSTSLHRPPPVVVNSDA